MLAHQQGAVVNVAQLACNLEVDAKSAHNYISLLTDLLLLRRLPAWHGNVGKQACKPAFTEIATVQKSICYSLGQAGEGVQAMSLVNVMTQVAASSVG
ncbi:MAG: hypothetical protein QM533_04155 [Cytophagales bacterium]|nr:hypothetical protein [Cytophagales bacterium]